MKKLSFAVLVFFCTWQVALASTQVAINTNRGSIVIELYDDEMPKTVENFLHYVDEGFYDNTIFHRVIPGFVIQGGGFTKELSKKDTEEPIKNEASEDRLNLRGTIAMARRSSPDSATSQFFINLQDNPSLDWREWNVGYAVFGRVVQGMDVVDLISQVPTGNTGIYRDVPIDAVEILNAYRIQTE